MFERPCWAMNSILLIRITCLLRSYINVFFFPCPQISSHLSSFYIRLVCVFGADKHCLDANNCNKIPQYHTNIGWHTVCCAQRNETHIGQQQQQEKEWKWKKKNRPTANNGQMQCRKRPNDEHTRCIGVSNCFTCFLFSFGFLPRWMLLVCKQTGFRMDGWIG